MSAALTWIHWWHHAWQLAAIDWQPPGLDRLSISQLHALARGHHAALAKGLGITPCMPPEPNPAMQALLCTPATLTLACELVAATCSPRSAAPMLSTQDRAWCERTAKALRPGHWLEPDQDSLALLRAWLGEPTWERARLSFPRARVEALERWATPQPPAARLDTLWQSVCWRTGQRPAPITPPAHDTETPDARPSLA
ncbi:type III secretion protein [uncultured Pseudomonas sp.]|uniref:type III secretion protein n=1 Tax=uncultured Pseudomonas sp. TaxID=114707 RepID=UPI0025E6B978|nr:type III secretion protein [uncultured Pseudomonas sp.]